MIILREKQKKYSHLYIAMRSTILWRLILKNCCESWAIKFKSKNAFHRHHQNVWGKSFSIARDSHKKNNSFYIIILKWTLICNIKKDCIFLLLSCMHHHRVKQFLLCDNLTCKRCNNLLMLMLSCYMSSYRVVACEGPRTEGTWYTYTLMTLSNVSS